MSDYLFIMFLEDSKMRLKNFDLMAAILIVAFNVGWTQIPGRPWIIGLILALPLVLILPGYTLTQLLFRKKSASSGPGQTSKPANSLRLGHPIGSTDQIILTLGLSMAIDILVGFVLNILPIGLQALSWALSLGILTVIFASLALFVRRRDTVTTGKVLRPRLALFDVLFLGLAAFVIINAIWLAAIRPPTPQPSFTQFWMVPADPTHKVCAVTLGIQNFELSSIQYNISMTVNGERVTGNWSTIALDPQQKWTQAVSITPEAQNDLHVEARLYRADQPSTVYREVHLTFHVSAGLQNGQAQQQCTLGT